MKKYFSYILILIVLAGLFSPVVNVYALCSNPFGNNSEVACTAIGGTWTADTTVPTNLETLAKGQAEGGIMALLYNLLQPLSWMAGALGVVAVGVLKIASYLTYLSGAVLNFVVQYTVVDMKMHLDEADAVNNAWKMIRDVANMGFIFVLLYAAIQTILGRGSDTKKIIVNIIIAAVLINFSLFFTKIVIDISNILAVLFYDAIAPGALSSNASIGISNSMMQPLGVQSIWKIATGFKGEQLLIIGVMGTIVSLISAFVFFAVAIMFVIRFVVLIFVLVLSPIAFVASALPGLDDKAKQWKNALIGQAFFAPIYFMLTWIVIVIARGMPTNTDTWANVLTGVAGPNGELLPPPATSIGIVVNFIIIIVMLIASLIIAKEWANKAPGGISKLTKWATGTAAIGGAALVGRHTIGRGAAAIADSERLKEMQEKGGARGMAARLTLAAGRKTAGGSLDIRGVGLGIGGAMDAGKAGGKGGFADFRKKQAEAAEKTAKAMGPSQETIDQAEQVVKNTREGTVEGDAARKRLDQLKGVTQKEVDKQRAGLDREKDVALKEVPESKQEKVLEDKIKEVEKKRAEASRASDEAEVITLDEELKKLEEQKRVVSETAKNARESIVRKYDEKKSAIVKIDSIGDIRKNAYAARMENSRWAKIRGYNKAAAAQIRKGKSKEKQLAEAYKKIAQDEEPETEAPSASPTPTAGGTTT